MRARVSRSPQFTMPLIPHIGLNLSPSHSHRFQFVDFGLGVEKLNSLKAAINQAGNSIQKPETEDVLVKEKENGRTREREKRLSQPAAALRLRSKQRWREVSRIGIPFKPNTRVPVGVLVVFL